MKTTPEETLMKSDSDCVWRSSFSKQACKSAQINIVEKECSDNPIKTEQRF